MIRIVRFYQYLYYRFYDLIKLTGNYDVAFGASHFMSLFISLVIVNLLLLFKEHLNVIILGFSAVLSFLVVHVMNYVIILKDSNYELIIKEHGNEIPFKKIFFRFLIGLMLMVLIYRLF